MYTLNSKFCLKRGPQEVWQPELLSRGSTRPMSKELGVSMVMEAYGAWGLKPLSHYHVWPLA